MALTLSGTSGIVGAGIGTIDSSGANVTGIGTFTQGHFSDHIYISDTICHTGDTNTKIRFPTNDNISFETGGSQRLLIATGTVAVGGASNDPPASPDGNLHIQDGSAGSVTASTAGNLAVFEDSASNGISILVPAAERANIYFGTPGTNGEIEAGIQYAHESVSTAADRRDMIFRAGGGEKVRIQGTGGISFNGDNTSANALDDYEEGSWTPRFTNVNAPTYTSQTGRYVKIGAYVHCTGLIAVGSGLDTSDGSTFAITDLPLTGNGDQEACIFTLGRYFDLLGSKATALRACRFTGLALLLQESNNDGISYSEGASSGTLEFAFSYSCNF